jgi:hypothetical protein
MHFYGKELQKHPEPKQRLYVKKVQNKKLLASNIIKNNSKQETSMA